ncbi:hypothetical protein DCN71_23865 [Salmonella enterica]|uniref:hypothetical protein n=1 Tax=Enterobacteriaceae TaxID=543 RepID=UPI0001DC485A|nr:MULTISPECIES: hypothetical protein [Enterobacteriaceae]EAO0314134.1 hypothetical protein [Salmonella enterica]ECE0738535.1 hypothetical protein [Salmonella enterica subsp. enterica serovar Hvittingfoss]ECH8732028.1 hypothetical protein [Salmonella enterica subsp. enterica serovar Wandsworth]EHG3621463.1 hypothetical protein [Salmonella enterica subsp. enterica serovar 6,8,[20]:e,h-]EKY5003020.1 hypothetical protein [Citrobacter amalonaticus]MDQ9206065.1 hypothetical protein [Cronobacter sa
MSDLTNIYEGFFSQPGRIKSFEKKRIISEKGVLISFYEAQVEYPNGEISSHIYYPDKKIKDVLNVWVVFDCFVTNEKRYIMHIYQ